MFRLWARHVSRISTNVTYVKATAATTAATTATTSQHVAAACFDQGNVTYMKAMGWV